MAKPSSIPVRKRTSTTPRPIIPTVISFIGASKDLLEIDKQNEALHNATPCQAIGDGIKGKLPGQGYLSGSVKASRIDEKVPGDEDENGNTHETSDDVKDGLYTLGEPLDKKVHKDMSSHK
jgi:hypothetical protein